MTDNICWADYLWLTGDEAAQRLDEADRADADVLAAASALRASLSSQRTHLVLEQAALRGRAVEKFALARRMFFTARALEQATDEIVADYKARRFPPGATVCDLCNGIGGDLLAMARGRHVVGVDRDPVVALFAEANLRVLACTDPDGADAAHWSATVRAASVCEADVADCAAWHIDPDRRPAGRRTTRVELHEPGVEMLDRLLARQPNAAIKLAPAAELPPHWAERAELEWIGRARQCRQLVAWFGDLANSRGCRRATVIGTSADKYRTIVGQADLEVPLAGRVGRYVFEPDAAVLAAKLRGVLAADHGLGALGPKLAYLTGDRAIVDPAISCFEVHDVLPYQPKRLKALLRERGIGRLEVKKRGVDLDPAAVRRQLKVPGEAAATLLLARIEGVLTAILGRRVETKAEGQSNAEGGRRKAEDDQGVTM